MEAQHHDQLWAERQHVHTEGAETILSGIWSDKTSWTRQVNILQQSYDFSLDAYVKAKEEILAKEREKNDLDLDMYFCN